MRFPTGSVKRVKRFRRGRGGFWETRRFNALPLLFPVPVAPDSWSFLCPPVLWTATSLPGLQIPRFSPPLPPRPPPPLTVLLPLRTSSSAGHVLPTPTDTTLVQAPSHLVLGLPSLQSTPDTAAKQPFKPGSDDATPGLRHLPRLSVANDVKDNAANLQKLATGSYLLLPCAVILCASRPPSHSSCCSGHL